MFQECALRTNNASNRNKAAILCALQGKPRLELRSSLLQYSSSAATRALARRGAGDQGMTRWHKATIHHKRYIMIISWEYSVIYITRQIYKLILYVLLCIKATYVKVTKSIWLNKRGVLNKITVNLFSWQRRKRKGFFNRASHEDLGKNKTIGLKKN